MPISHRLRPTNVDVVAYTPERHASYPSLTISFLKQLCHDSKIGFDAYYAKWNMNVQVKVKLLLIAGDTVRSNFFCW
jgi:hypothetical protein